MATKADDGLMRLGPSMKKFARRLFLVGTLVPRPIFSVAEAEDADAPRRILVLSNPIHTDIAIPIDASVREKFAFLEQAGVPAGHPDARWLVLAGAAAPSIWKRRHGAN